MAVIPTVVLQRVNMQSASHFVSHCVRHPDFPVVEKKTERICEECGGHLETLSDLSKEVTGPSEI